MADDEKINLKSPPLKPLPRHKAPARPEPPPVVRLKVSLDNGFILGIGFWVATFVVGLIIILPIAICLGSIVSR